jgi:predicted aspartyl protease
VPALAAWVTALLLVTGCGVVTGEDLSESAPAGRQVPLKVIERGDRALAFVPVTIDGRGPFMFALDTGASASAIDQDIAEELGVARTGRSVTVSGIGGTERVHLVEVPRWRVGTVPLPSTQMAAIDLESPRDGRSLQGLLGSDVLSDFAQITIDYDDQQLELFGH